MHRRPTALAPVLLSCLLLAACGSTVATGAAGSAAAPGAVGDPSLGGTGETGTSAPVAQAAADPLTGAPAVVPGRGLQSRPASATAVPGGATQAGPSAVSGSTAVGALFPRTFKIGLQYTSNGAAAVSATSGGSFKGDGRDTDNAVIAWINKHGGIAGRPASASYNNIDASGSPSATSQSACAQWAQDDHVALAIPTSAISDMDLLRQCLKKANVPALMGYIASRTLRSSFANSPLWFENGALSLEDYAQTYVKGLAQQGFFTGGGKVGVVYYDKAPFTTALNSALLPALRAAGVAAPETFGASIDGATTLTSGSQEMSSAVLAFRSKGVTKVMFYEPWIGYFAFLNAAKSQGYHPTYGLTSQEGPQLAADLGFAPADQLKGARIVTWNPMTDMKGYQRYTGPRLALCNQILRAAGVSKATDQTGYWTQQLSCENLLLVQDAYRTAPRQLTPQDFVRGMEGLAATLHPATRLAGSFNAGKHWATSQYWNGHFDDATASFVLDGAPHQIG